MFGIDDLLIGVIAAVVVDIIANIAKALAVKNPNENVDELGDRVIQADEAGIHPENFEKYDDYMKAISEFEVDPERSKEISLDNKREKGVNCLLAGIAEKSGIDTGIVPLLVEGINNNKDFFKEFQDGVIKAVISNPKLLEDLGRYICDDKIDIDTYTRTLDTLTKIIKETNPQVSDTSAEDQARNLRK